MIIDKLIDRIKFFKNPTAAGLDTCLEYLPPEMLQNISSLADAADAILEFNKNIIDSICDIVPCVKVQVAYYEMYGFEGMRAFARTIEYAKRKGMLVIADVKRNDIGSTAKCYSSAYFSGVEIGGKKLTAFDSDFITVNAYLGSDGINPFLADCKDYNRGMFILVKTSNPASSEIQDKLLQSGGTVYELMGGYVDSWGKDLTGKYGFSSVGAVVGATHPKQAKHLRDKLENVFFLIPGYGAQGGGAKDLAVCFDKRGLGGVVNSSRGILLAYKNPLYKGQGFAKAAKSACLDMQSDIMGAINA